MTEDSSTHRAILNVLEDIESVKKELESEKLRFGLILENLGDPVAVLDKDGRVLYFNPQAMRIFNITKGGQFNYPDITAKINEVVQSGSNFETELILRPEGAEEIFLRAVMAPFRLPAGEIEGVVVVFNNVTELRKLDRLKYDFIATVSHELRTPLTVIAETISMLREGAIGDLTPKQKECVELAERNEKRLAKLVDNVLDIVKMETGHLKIEIGKVLIQPLITGLVNSFKPLFDKKGLTLSADIDPVLPAIAADEDRLAQVIANLLNNAYKYTVSGGVEISAVVERKMIKFCVKDTGIGISEENLKKIFGKYEQVKNTGNVKPPEKGSGLGLYIAKNLVEEQGGKIWVESEINKGSLFCFTIPVYKGG
ncbi:hypothetical protein A2276_03115 [candidate division WOR-1 bacterium RIFOXYA12_FULL_43_27]|uniref:histidine kinase n=1 Tax=candidate division WOR-1 bacterium RIFOXYC2_FULL_46_14 TaxID=1802587 RepID=A0A1F4U7P1_UNCSA|nr:MAG: hypothetical protein A2276_03115 [candidate division WOR-1 bacterium RIFOXYA12_FULL_43_27]OGC19307.1 MAG: hypothetical protein A2292_01220 [candidate division WOR-1 bacterium RIFOXYB2_FULL_46_45]OGC30296.1 MAG: hypothetical protein A2232_01220 [candidate division WOR-1 bacterium RIFOXYA2_FULL_46_56]OGC40897.1 MAG: hypothetical protein A2438_01220 [candidate division WOR-1 bacterium RIFOXYC2_FULL_46_14]